MFNRNITIHLEVIIVLSWQSPTFVKWFYTTKLSFHFSFDYIDDSSLRKSAVAWQSKIHLLTMTENNVKLLFSWDIFIQANKHARSEVICLCRSGSRQGSISLLRMTSDDLAHSTRPKVLLQNMCKSFPKFATVNHGGVRWTRINPGVMVFSAEELPRREVNLDQSVKCKCVRARKLLRNGSAMCLLWRRDGCCLLMSYQHMDG